jgi:hypothetical protein
MPCAISPRIARPRRVNTGERDLVVLNLLSVLA